MAEERALSNWKRNLHPMTINYISVPFPKKTSAKLPFHSLILANVFNNNC